MINRLIALLLGVSLLMSCVRENADPHLTLLQQIALDQRYADYIDAKEESYQRYLQVAQPDRLGELSSTITGFCEMSPEDYAHISGAAAYIDALCRHFSSFNALTAAYPGFTDLNATDHGRLRLIRADYTGVDPALQALEQYRNKD